MTFASAAPAEPVGLTSRDPAILAARLKDHKKQLKECTKVDYENMQDENAPIFKGVCECEDVPDPDGLKKWNVSNLLLSLLAESCTYRHDNFNNKLR